MYAIVKTGGKQYKVAAGDVISIEKLPVEVGSTVNLDAICIVDGDKVETDPTKAAETAVVAEVLEQYKDKKQLVFKFKKRKNYHKLQGHRQRLTRVRIVSVGSEKAPEAAPKAKAAKAEEAAPAEAAAASKAEAVAVNEEKAAKAPAKSAAKTTAKTVEKTADEKKAAKADAKDGAADAEPAKKTTRKRAPKKEEAASEDAE